MLIGKNKRKVGKKALCLVFAFLFSINSFAAVVSDNDGSAFVTKSEFEALKKGFADQIDNYNTSIDNKIDGAIATYLAGLRLNTISDLDVVSPGTWVCINEQHNSSDYTWRYKYGSPRISFISSVGGGYYWASNRAASCMMYYYTLSAPTYVQSKHSQHKLAIKNLSETRRTAEWYGIAYNCDDSIVAISSNWNAGSLEPTSDDLYLTYFRPKYNVIKTDTIIGKIFIHFGFADSIDGQSLNYEMEQVAREVNQNWGIIKNNKIILASGSKPYKNFSLYPNQRNWGFYTTDTSDASSYEKLWQVLTGGGETYDPQISNSFNAGGTGVSAYEKRLWTNTEYHNANGKYVYFCTRFGGGSRSDVWGKTGDMHKTWPCLGFEEDYITDWNQLYTTNFDDVANDTIFASDRSVFLQDNDGAYHVALKNGIPLVKVPSQNAKITWEIDLSNITFNITNGDETVTYPTTDTYVWISEDPYTGWPNNNDCLTFTPLDGTCTTTTAANFTKAIKIPASQRGKAKVQFEAPNKNKFIWIKWATNGIYGGGAINLPKTVLCEEE